MAFQNIISRVLILSLLFNPCFAVGWAGEQPDIVSPSPTDQAAMHRVIREKLASYDRLFPEIEFVYLSNGDEWAQSLQALDLLLGYQPTNLDYEHPPELREDLLFVTVAKIQMMLIYHMASSYLFRVGEIPAASREHVCVVTLDPMSMALNDATATRHMLDLTDEEFQLIPRTQYLNKDDHLDFIIDHEVYHCLDTLYYGPITRSDKVFWGKYSCFQRERQADLYALARHIQRHQSITPHVEKIRQLRGMTLLNGEIQHDSAQAITRLMKSDAQVLLDSTPRELIDTVKHLDQDMKLSYGEYLKFRLNALEAIHRLGKEVNELSEPVYPEGLEVDEELVRELMDQTTGYYRAYIGQDYPDAH